MTLPRDNLAEQALLSACMISPHIVVQVRQRVAPKDYFSTAHQEIARTIYQAPERDLVALASALRESGKLEAVGGQKYLQTLVDVVSSSAGWRTHADTVLSCSRRRQVIIACQDAASRAAEQTDIEGVLSGLNDSLRDVVHSSAPVAIDNEAVLRVVYDKAIDKRRVRGLLAGFPKIDAEDRLGVMEEGSTIYLAARPSVGKTALALALIDNALTQDAGAVLFFSLEMTGEAIQRRRLASRSDVFLSSLRHGSVSTDRIPDLRAACDDLCSPHPVIVDDPAFKTVERLTGYAQAVAQDKRLALIVVDHIQKMSTSRRVQSRHHELSYVSERLCDLSKELRVPVMVLCQLRRAEDPSKARRPRLEDMKESGDLEQNADVVLGLYRESKESRSMEVSCLKHRDGAAGWVEYLDFDPPTQRFRQGQKLEGGKSESKGNDFA